jgi:hypothetical protein
MGVTEGGLEVMGERLGERCFIGQDNAVMWVKGVTEGGLEVMDECLGERFPLPTQ